MLVSLMCFLKNILSFQINISDVFDKAAFITSEDDVLMLIDNHRCPMLLNANSSSGSTFLLGSLFDCSVISYIYLVLTPSKDATNAPPLRCVCVSRKLFPNHATHKFESTMNLMETWRLIQSILMPFSK